jgi:hypothetical protein
MLPIPLKMEGKHFLFNLFSSPIQFLKIEKAHFDFSISNKDIQLLKGTDHLEKQIS